MALATGPRVALRYIKEVTPGTTPATPTMKRMRTVERGINLSKEALESDEIRSDRRETVFRHGFRQVNGSLGFEYAPVDFDDLLESALGGTWTADVLKDGTDVDYYTIERGFEDISRFQSNRGCVINELSIGIQPRRIVRAGLNWIGLDADDFVNATVATVTTEPTYAQPFTAFEGSVQIQATPVAIVTGIDMTLTNNRSVEAVVGEFTSPQVFDGKFQVRGTLSCFLQDATIYGYFLDETEVSIQVELADIAGTSTHTILLPKCKLNAGDMSPPTSGPVVMQMPFAAIYDSGQSCVVKITRNYP